MEFDNFSEAIFLFYLEQLLWDALQINYSTLENYENEAPLTTPKNGTDWNLISVGIHSFCNPSLQHFCILFLNILLLIPPLKKFTALHLIHVSA